MNRIRKKLSEPARGMELLIPVGAVVLCLAGCQTVGATFRHEHVAGLRLGDRLTDYAARFGEPQSGEIEQRDGVEYERVVYVFAQSHAAKSPSVRLLALELANGTVNAYIFASGFNSDRTFSPMPDALPAEGASRAEVLAALGEPNGRIRCPTTLPRFDLCQGSSELWVWNNIQPARGDRLILTRVQVAFDATLTVRAVVRATSTVGGRPQSQQMPKPGSRVAMGMQMCNGGHSAGTGSQSSKQ